MKHTREKQINPQQRYFYSFLKAVRGNWHNALFVTCSCADCPYGHVKNCGGFLMAVDADGAPLLIPAKQLRRLTGEEILNEECRGQLAQADFEAAYSLYLEWHTESLTDCLLWQLGPWSSHVPDAADDIKPIPP